MFIKLTMFMASKPDIETHVAVKHITHFYPTRRTWHSYEVMENGMEKGAQEETVTWVAFDAGTQDEIDGLSCRETPEEILKLIREAH